MEAALRHQHLEGHDPVNWRSCFPIETVHVDVQVQVPGRLGGLEGRVALAGSID